MSNVIDMQEWIQNKHMYPSFIPYKNGYFKMKPEQRQQEKLEVMRMLMNYPNDPGLKMKWRMIREVENEKA